MYVDYLLEWDAYGKGRGIFEEYLKNEDAGQKEQIDMLWANDTAKTYLWIIKKQCLTSVGCNTLDYWMFNSNIVHLYDGSVCLILIIFDYWWYLNEHRCTNL